MYPCVYMAPVKVLESRRVNVHVRGVFVRMLREKRVRWLHVRHSAGEGQQRDSYRLDYPQGVRMRGGCRVVGAGVIVGVRVFCGGRRVRQRILFGIE